VLDAVIREEDSLFCRPMPSSHPRADTKEVHLHAGTRAFRQRLGKGVRDFPSRKRKFLNVIVRCAERIPLSIAGKI
jgi:hypothetical protein